MKDLSVIIVSYNTKDLTEKVLRQIIPTLSASKSTSEIIVVDNASSDGTVEMLHKMKASAKTPTTFIENKINMGFSKANNQGANIATGRYILFLNSDVLVESLNIDELLSYIDKNQNVGALTVKVVLSSGKLDPACHRGFPTLWRSFTYFTKLEKVFGRFPLFSRLFGGYHLTDKNLLIVHEIDSPSGAFYLTTAQIFTEVEGFDEDYFMYGEDVDLSYKIKARGYKIIYYPLQTVTHLKYQSGLKKNSSATKINTKRYFYDAMRIFYDKHYASSYPAFVNRIVHGLIQCKKVLL